MSDRKTVCSKMELPIVEKLDEYVDQRETNRSTAVRELVRDGLEDRDQSEELTNGQLLFILTAFILGVGIEPQAPPLYFVGAAIAVFLGGMYLDNRHK